MKTSNLLGGALLASSLGTHNQVDAKAWHAAARGACNGAVSTAVKNIAGALQENKTNAPEEHSQSLLPQIGHKAARAFPVSFCSNAISTAVLDRLFKVSIADTVKNMDELVLPVACSEIAKELLSDVKMSPHAKAGLAYGAFWAGRLAQGKDPVKSAIAVSGFAAGATLVKSLSHQSRAQTQGLYSSAVSGFISPDTQSASDASHPKSRDDFIRERYNLQPHDKIWEGPDGSLFLPASDSTKH